MEPDKYKKIGITLFLIALLLAFIPLIGLIPAPISFFIGLHYYKKGKKIEKKYKPIIENQCQKCKSPNPKDFKFCRKCGYALFSVCPHCKKKIDNDSIFCGYCGKKIILK